MRWLRRVLFLGGFVSVLTVFAPFAGATQEPRVPVPDGTASLSQFGGVWDYNSDESVDAATGRPEQGPKSATQRGAARGTAPRGGGGGRGPSPASLPSSDPGGDFGGGGGGRTRGGGLDMPGLGPTSDMVQQGRDLNRDLLEVPEALNIRIEPSAVTFTDDLDRSWTYQVSGPKQKYQVGAAKFEAVVTWSEGQLLKRIEGAYGFRMTETYFLSPDGKRLFVIMRVGTPRKGQPVIGVNRVYDRVE